MLKILSIIPSIVTRCFKNSNKVEVKTRLKEIRKKVAQAESLIPPWYNERDRREVLKQVRRCLKIIDTGINSNAWCQHTLMAEVMFEVDILEIKLPELKELNIRKLANQKKNK